MKKQGLLIAFLALMLLLASVPSGMAAGIPITAANFPDANFRAVLLGRGIDRNQNKILDSDEITNTTTLVVTSQNITSLQGIQYLTALKSLWCENNRLTTLDVSKLSKLQNLYCSGNQLSSLKVTGMGWLARLDCHDNQLTTLNVGGLTNLQYLTCYNNRLTVLDLSNVPYLKEVNCKNNQLTSLDVSANTRLTYLSCTGNQLSVTAEGGRFSLSSLPGFNVQKADNWQGGTVSGTVLTVPASGAVTYTYDCGNGYSAAFTLQVTVTGAAVMDEPDLVLPASLKSIRAEAFSRVSAAVVLLPQSVTSIGEYAFAYCPNLRQIYIPAGAQIADTAFAGVTGLTIFGAAGSPAETFANRHGNTQFVVMANP